MNAPATPPAREPRNPFYFLLLLTSVLFIMTVLAIAFVPLLEEKARQSGQPVPPSPFREGLGGENGVLWLLGEVAAMIVFGFLSMALDRLRSLQKQRTDATIPPNQPPPS